MIFKNCVTPGGVSRNKTLEQNIATLLILQVFGSFFTSRSWAVDQTSFRTKVTVVIFGLTKL
jgi:hypothetical protein